MVCPEGGRRGDGAHKSYELSEDSGFDNSDEVCS